MPIEFSCSSCQSVLRTPDQSAGKSARCPQCGNIEPIPDPQQDSSDSKPGSVPFAEIPVAHPVYSDSRQTAAIDNSWSSDLNSEQSVRVRLQTPAVTVLVFCSLAVLFSGLGVVGGLISVVENGAMPEDVVGLVGCAGVILLEGIGILGSISMLRMRNYAFCVAGMICAIIGGLICCFVPSGFAVWGLVVLLDPDVKRYFQ